MARSVRVPDSVYEQIDREASQRDVTHGQVVREYVNPERRYLTAEEIDERIDERLRELERGRRA